MSGYVSPDCELMRRLRLAVCVGAIVPGRGQSGHSDKSRSRWARRKTRARRTQRRLKRTARWC